jgi:hypothetical protein
MDGSTLPAPLYTALGYLIPLAIAAAVVRSPWFKGKAGKAIANLAATFKNHRQHVAYLKHVLANRESVPYCLKYLGERVRRTVERGANAEKEFWGVRRPLGVGRLLVLRDCVNDAVK